MRSWLVCVALAVVCAATIVIAVAHLSSSRAYERLSESLFAAGIADPHPTRPVDVAAEEGAASPRAAHAGD